MVFNFIIIGVIFFNDPPQLKLFLNLILALFQYCLTIYLRLIFGATGFNDQITFSFVS